MVGPYKCLHVTRLVSFPRSFQSSVARLGRQQNSFQFNGFIFNIKKISEGEQAHSVANLQPEQTYSEREEHISDKTQFEDEVSDSKESADTTREYNRDKTAPCDDRGVVFEWYFNGHVRCCACMVLQWACMCLDGTLTGPVRCCA